MHGNGLLNRYSLTLKSTPPTYAPLNGGIPTPFSPATTLSHVDPLDDRFRVKVEKSASRTWTTRFNIPCLWSCILIVGILLCLINEQVGAFPTRNSAIEKSIERSKRSVSDHNYDQMALNWLLDRRNERSLLPSLRSREARNIPDQILAQMEAEWYEANYGSDSATGSANGRSRRFANPRHQEEEAEEEEEERVERRRSLADQRLAELLAHHRLRHPKSPFHDKIAAAEGELDFDQLG